MGRRALRERRQSGLCKTSDMSAPPLPAPGSSTADESGGPSAPSSTGSGEKAQQKAPRPWGEWLLAVALLAPSLILLVIFTYRPLLDNIRLSFYNWNISSPRARFIGLDNYREWFTARDTGIIVWNTVVFTLATVVGSLLLG